MQQNGRIFSDAIVGRRLALSAGAAIFVLTFSATLCSAASAATITLKPGDDVQAAVDSNPPGSLYLFEAGLYRLQSIIPKDGDVFDGQGTAILNGSQELKTFERSGRMWVVLGQTQKGYVLRVRECQPGYPRCSRPEDLYIDDKPQHHVDSLHKVGPGTWYFDYAGSKVFIGDDPVGKKVEIGTTPLAFGGRAANVIVRNFTIEKYAAPLHAIDTEHGNAWTVENNLIRLNHSLAVNAGRNSKIVGNRLVHNGQQGFAGGGNNFLIEGNEIAHNNYAGVNFEWEAGGGKVTESNEGAVIRGNCVHDNDGPGIWADENARGLVIENNVVFNNSANGIMYEISADGIIRNNLVANNGKKKFRWFWGPQILISGSSNVQVYQNVVDVPADYGNAITIVAQNRRPHPPAIDNQIFNNTIVMRGTDARIGAATDFSDYVTPVATKNVLRQNQYHVTDLAAPFWHWNEKDLNWNEIRSEGQEVGSTIDNRLPPEPKLDCAFLHLK